MFDTVQCSNRMTMSKKMPSMSRGSFPFIFIHFQGETEKQTTRADKKTLSGPYHARTRTRMRLETNMKPSDRQRDFDRRIDPLSAPPQSQRLSDLSVVTNEFGCMIIPALSCIVRWLCFLHSSRIAGSCVFNACWAFDGTAFQFQFQSQFTELSAHTPGTSTL